MWSTLLMFLVLMGLVTWLHLHAPATVTTKLEQSAYLQQLEKENSTNAAKRAWQRLHRRHGSPGAVVYEPGKTPYYINANGQMCRFI
jgi:hypothetical protein